MTRYAIGIDLGATNIRVALGDDKGNLIKKIKKKSVWKKQELITNQIIKHIKTIINSTNIKKIEGIGIGSIGPLDIKRKAIINSPNIGVKFISLKSIKRVGLPVFLLNDCQAAVLGEWYFGVRKKIKVKNLVYITISSGIGGGAIVDEHLVFGETGNAVEIGHLIVDREYNILCKCKKGRGHWEAYCSGKNIPTFFKLWLKKENLNGINIKNISYCSSKEIFEAAKRKDKIALKFIKKLGEINGIAISNIIVAYNPGVITLGGRVTLENKMLILRAIKENVDHYLKIPKIMITPLGEDVVLYGAIAAVFNKIGSHI